MTIGWELADKSANIIHHGYCESYYNKTFLIKWKEKQKIKKFSYQIILFLSVVYAIYHKHKAHAYTFIK